MCGVRRHHEEVVLAQLRHGEIGLDPPVVVEPLGVRDDAGIAVHRTGRQLVEELARARSGHPELRHERHVHQPDAVADGVVLVLPLGEPRRTSPRRLGLRGATRAGEPVSALPTRHLAQVAALLDESLVHRRQQAVPCRTQLLPGRVRGIHRAEDLGGSSGSVRRLELVGAEPVDVEARDVDIRLARRDPVRQHPAEPAGRQHTDGVHPSRHEVSADARRLTDGRRQIGGERLRPAEERPNSDLHA